MFKKHSSTPYVFWCAVFIIFPLFLVFWYSIQEKGPMGEMMISLDNYKTFMQPLYLKILWRSVRLALEATGICLLIGYPMAMILAGMEERMQKLFMLLLVLPMWMNFLLRTYAWLAILGKNGFVNKVLSIFGVPTIQFLYNEGAILFGMVYNFLPFMILPIYTVLSKIDNCLIEAANDLGANKRKTLWKVIIPLSVPGIISGVTMVFMPAVSTFVISTLLGGGQYDLVGNVIEQQFMIVGNWGFGSSIAIVLMLFILASSWILNKYDTEEGGEVGLW